MKPKDNIKPEFKTFDEFFQFYLSEHSNKNTKLVHVIGTLTGVAFLIYCFLDRRPLWIPLAPLITYGILWASHIFIEHNQPVTFRYYRLWAIAADFRMVFLILTGKLRI
jgi:hypothetical protein